MEALFVWYDYFSCPQWECHVTNQRDDYNQANAINSIPGYIAKCKFFVALCPTLGFGVLHFIKLFFGSGFLIMATYT